MTGRVVILNGCSSSGKTTLARAFLAIADTPWVAMAQDDVAQALVPHWIEVDGAHHGEHGTDGFHFVRTGTGALVLRAGPVGQRLLRGYRRAVAAMAQAGNDVLVDETNVEPGGAADWRSALAGLETTWVQVRADRDVCLRREGARPDRQALQGLVAGQFDIVHDGITYDVVIDTTDHTPEEAAAELHRRIRTAGPAAPGAT